MRPMHCQDQPESIVTPDRMNRFRWSDGELDFVPRNAVLRSVWLRAPGPRARRGVDGERGCPVSHRVVTGMVTETWVRAGVTGVRRGGSGTTAMFFRTERQQVRFLPGSLPDTVCQPLLVVRVCRVLAKHLLNRLDDLLGSRDGRHVAGTVDHNKTRVRY
jgi:hypothetical protein